VHSFKEVVMRLPLLNLGLALALCSQAPVLAQETKPEQKKSEAKKSETKKPDEKKAPEKTAEKPATDKQAAPAKPAWNPYSTLQQYKIVAAIDEDLNGMITAKEWESSVERILKLDTNGDGKLVSEEFLKEGEIAKSVLGFGVVKGLDVDQDGSLSAEEIKGAVEVLKKLDSNKSGKLEPNEYSMKSPMSMGGGSGGGAGGGGGRQMPSPEEFMKSNDKNSDGKVEKSELAGPAANFFDRMDENKDGGITLEEVKASRERMRQQGGGAGAGGRGGGGRGGPGGPGGAAPGATEGSGEKKSDTPKADPPK
jgi:hypothetical protein